MHRVSPLLRIKLVFIVFIGTFSGLVNAQLGGPDLDELHEKGLVYVEPIDVVMTNGADEESRPRDYIERRGKWGFTIGAAYSFYEPKNFETNFGTGSYADVYTAPTSPMIELHLQLKRNLSIGSLGLDISGGQFRNENSASALVPATLALTKVEAGLMFSLDTLFREPYVVPYAEIGAYEMIYSESFNADATAAASVPAQQSVAGQTTPAMFVAVGLAFQLDWIDSHSAHLSYADSKLQSTYLYAEGRQYSVSPSSDDPNFGTDFTYNAGLKLEF